MSAIYCADDSEWRIQRNNSKLRLCSIVIIILVCCLLQYNVAQDFAFWAHAQESVRSNPIHVTLLAILICYRILLLLIGSVVIVIFGRTYYIYIVTVFVIVDLQTIFHAQF
jgi:hypothetical protein